MLLTPSDSEIPHVLILITLWNKGLKTLTYSREKKITSPVYVPLHCNPGGPGQPN